VEISVFEAQRVALTAQGINACVITTASAQANCEGRSTGLVVIAAITRRGPS
jgi:hypothetical protein